MVYKWLFPILLVNNICCETNNARKQTESSSALKTSRFNILSGNFEDQNSPENYFPEIEYPSDILDMTKPYYFKATGDAVLEPFPRDVKDSFKIISTGGKYVEEPVVRNIAVSKPARPILQSSSSLLKNWTKKDKTVTLNKMNSTSVLVQNKGKNNVTYVEEKEDSHVSLSEESLEITSLENNSTEIIESQENFHSKDEPTSNFKDFNKEDEATVTSEE